MREIKFRGYNEFEKKWVYGYGLHQSIFIDGSSNAYVTAGIREVFIVDKESAGQYTGCKDANDKEIYEGDIVEIVDGPTLHPDNCYIGTKFKVFYNQESCSFMMQDIYDEDNTQYFDLDLGGIPPKYLEVIGNIYENKELLEVE